MNIHENGQHYERRRGAPRLLEAHIGKAATTDVSVEAATVYAQAQTGEELVSSTGPAPQVAKPDYLSPATRKIIEYQHTT